MSKGRCLRVAWRHHPPRAKMAPVSDTDGWVQVGTVMVDSGRCLVVDPTYHRDGVYGVNEVEAATMASVTSPTGTALLSNSAGLEIGVVVGTGYGDDVYPVEVRYHTDERGTRRVSEVRVRFIEP